MPEKLLFFRGSFFVVQMFVQEHQQFLKYSERPLWYQRPRHFQKSLKKILLTHSGARPCNQVYPSALEFLLCD